MKSRSDVVSTSAKATPAINARPKALDTLIAITELAVSFRYADRQPTISDVARVVSTASRVLRFNDVDERIETENAAVLTFAKQKGILGKD
jgi:hypothetical protein